VSIAVAGRGLVRRFRAAGRTVTALDGVDLAVAAGEVVAVTGPSGSGKTTPLSLVSGLDRPDEGAVEIAGVPTAGLDAAALARLRLERVGLVLQSGNLLAALTAGENAALTLELRGFGAAARRRRVAELFERLGIAGLQRRYPGELSGGEQQRVAVARALAGEPAVIVADEPTAHLDSVAAAALLDLVRELARERAVAAVVASHDPLVAARADRTLRLHDGRAAP